jgi:hypothetical protein
MARPIIGLTESQIIGTQLNYESWGKRVQPGFESEISKGPGSRPSGHTSLPLNALPTSSFARSAWAITLLLLSATSLFAADYSRPTLRHHSKPVPPRAASTARIALFELNDLPRAAKLAQREIKRSPGSVDPWFLAMETASLGGDAATELQGAIAVCKFAKPSDPRVLIAAMRLDRYDDTSEALRRHRPELESLAAQDNPCSAGATQALYRAALHGLPNTDIRSLAQNAGWINKWTITRTTGNGSPELFEFPDARLTVPDYLSHTAHYVAESEFSATSSGNYTVAGDLGAAHLTIDDHDISGPTPLQVGPHKLKLEFRPADIQPRLRIVAVSSFDNEALAALKLPRRESAYIEAAALVAIGSPAAAASKLNESELADTLIGQQLLHPQPIASPAPDLLEHARWLASRNRHLEAIDELSQIIHEWPLDREARRLHIAELQRVGNNSAADRAAAEFLAIAPNARNFRRMAQRATAELTIPDAPFYTAYRRPAPAPIATADAPAVILLEDKVAITRPDGSVSLYIHRVVQLMTLDGVQQFQPLPLPEGAQVLSSRIVDGELSLNSGAAKAGNEVEEEYVVHYTGDGGMAAHPEAFQDVFNNFDAPILSARFIVLSPATETPGYVIASGDAPESRIEFTKGLRAQIWEKTSTASATSAAPTIIRVVENENGWSIPPSIERRRNLLTIHPGPRNREA